LNKISAMPFRATGSGRAREGGRVIVPPAFASYIA